MLIGAGSTLLGQNLTAARALVSDVNGKIGASTITAAELQYLAGVTKNIQAQFGELNENIMNPIPVFSDPDDYLCGNYCGSMNVNGTHSAWMQIDGGYFVQQIKVTNINAEKNETYTRVKINNADWSGIAWNRLSDIKTAMIDISRHTWTSGSEMITRIGNTAHINLGLLNVTCNKDDSILTIPEGFRPQRWTTVYMYMKNESEEFMIRTASISNGSLLADVNLVNAYILINASWTV
jgi:hypothetical protein